MSNKLKKYPPINPAVVGLVLGLAFWLCPAFAEVAKESPLIINGDNVEYSADSREVVATGNIEVIYKGAKLTW